MNVRDPKKNFEALWLTHCGRAANRSRVTAHQCMRQINDPIQPGAEQILLASHLSLPRPRRSSPSITSSARNHSLRFEGIAKTILQENRSAATQFRQNHYLERLNHPSRSTPRNTSRATTKSTSHPTCYATRVGVPAVIDPLITRGLEVLRSKSAAAAGEPGLS